MTTTTTNATESISEIGRAYGRMSRIATAREMALASDVVGSDDAMLMVEKKTGQAWKWDNHFKVWATMSGWTGYTKMVRGEHRAFC